MPSAYNHLQKHKNRGLSSIKGNRDRQSASFISKTRKRAIAKALQLNGHSDFAPVDLAYYQHFLFFCSKILRFGEFRLATTNTDLIT